MNTGQAVPSHSDDPLAGKLAIRGSELAEVLSISRSHAFELLRRNEIPSRRIGKRGRVVAVADVRAWLAGRGPR